jgi:hypothetical protein
MGLAVQVPSQARQDALSEYISELRRRMNLAHWTVRIMWEYPDREYGDGSIQAEITMTEGRYLATLRLGEGFWDLDADAARAVLVHELLHIHHVRVSAMTDWGRLKLLVGEPVHSVIQDNLDRELEIMVDTLTSVLVEHMPAPEKWPK